jgi:hypothetical protein
MDSTAFKQSITSVVPGDVIACVTHQPDFHRLADSYMQAARMLVRHLGEDGLYRDVGILPICFMYRHSLELTFKQIVWDGRRLLGEEGRIREICKSHQIKPLWAEIEKIMSAVWPNEPVTEEALLVREVVSWFHEADERSFSFRYPFDQQQQPCLEGLRHVNLTVLVDAMETTGLLLSGVAGGVTEYLSIQQSL